MLDPKPTAAGRLICALDVASQDEALRLADELAGIVSFYKVGWQLFLAAGFAMVEALAARGNRVFLDLKMDDIDETVRLGVREVAKRPGIALLTLQGSAATARAARAGRGDAAAPALLQVTALSSTGPDELREMGLVGAGGKFATLDDFVLFRARRSLAAGCEGVIASGGTVTLLRRELGPGFLIVCPGVRPAGAGSDEHKRTNTPAEAIRAGADYLVVGRPIRDAADRAAVAQAIVDEIDRASPAT